MTRSFHNFSFLVIAILAASVLASAQTNDVQPKPISLSGEEKKLAKQNDPREHDSTEDIEQLKTKVEKLQSLIEQQQKLLVEMQKRLDEVAPAPQPVAARTASAPRGERLDSGQVTGRAVATDLA